MNVCMHDYAMVRLTSQCWSQGYRRHLVKTMVSNVPASRVLLSSQITTSLMNISVYRTAPSPITSRSKSSLSVVSRVDQSQDCSWFSHRTTS